MPSLSPIFFVLPVLYFVLLIAVAAVVLTAVWRVMKAQEASARALEQVAYALMQRPSPPA